MERHIHSFDTSRSFQRKGEAPSRVGECACGKTAVLSAPAETMAAAA